MESKRAEMYIIEVYNLSGHGYNGGSLRTAQHNNNHPKYAIQAVEWAEEDMKQKAIEAYKKACTCIGCNHCDDCDSVREFVDLLNRN